MARFVCSMNVSLDGYVDHDRMVPDADVFRFWIRAVKRTPNTLYGRKIYQLMTYWQDDQPDWGDAEREFAEAWRAQKKWVVSTTLTDLGPNATLISQDIEAQIRALKARLDGEVDVSGTRLVQSLSDWGLMDEYRLVYHPLALGHGRPLFLGPRPPMRLAASDHIGDTAICLTYRT
ncbi:dihydrofolate reductase family protein [Tabrizicola sp.]|uniref:dihydrofolate reductase family protein n=1 Tax=Tabrizicola sp. TaxID=2005166 RepID=UPI0035B18A77